jgi:hypothetical protein
MYTASQAVVPATIENNTENNAPVIAANPLDLPADTFREGLDRRKQNRAALMSWIRDALIEGLDFGRIHIAGKSQCKIGRACKNPAHFSKPSLFKPGAEKICGMLGVTVRYPTLPDYEKAALTGTNLSQIIIRCEIVDAYDRVVGDGVGARIVSQDYGDINKALKMAEKSAHIDATLRMAGLSEVFTQDIEDMLQNREVEVTPDFSRINQDQYQALEDKIKTLGLDRKRVEMWMFNASKQRFSDFRELTPEFYDLLFNKLDQFAELHA